MQPEVLETSNDQSRVSAMSWVASATRVELACLSRRTVIVMYLGDLDTLSAGATCGKDSACSLARNHLADAQRD